MKNTLLYECHELTTWDHFGSTLIANGPIPELVVLTNFHKTDRDIHGLILEMLIKKQVDFSEISLKLPDRFLLVLMSNSKRDEQCQLLYFLKDYMFFRHHFEIEPDLEKSLVKSQIQSLEDKLPATNVQSLITQDEIETLAQKTGEVTVVPEIKVYMQNIVVYLRTHRLVRKGVSPKAVKDFERLLRAFCALHGKLYATPSLVALAARMIFPLKLELCSPEEEPTVHYGSDIHLLTKWIAKWDADMVIDDVLNAVPSPL